MKLLVIQTLGLEQEHVADEIEQADFELLVFGRLFERLKVVLYPALRRELRF